MFGSRTVSLQGLLEDLFECGCGRLSQKEIAEFEIRKRDILNDLNFVQLFETKVNNNKSFNNGIEKSYWDKYLSVRTALPKGSIGTTISVSVSAKYFGFERLWPNNGQVSAAATIVLALTGLVRVANKTALSSASSEYADIVQDAAACRAAGQPADRILRFGSSDHWCVFFKGTIYKLPVPQKLNGLAFLRLIKTFERITASDPSAVPNLLPAITSVDRDRAADLRDRFRKNPQTANTIKTVESAIAVIVLEDNEIDDDTGTSFQRKLMIGNGFNRWYGKTNFVVGQNGWAGIQIDHSLFNGEKGEKLLKAIRSRIDSFRYEHLVDNDLDSCSILEYTALPATEKFYDFSLLLSAVRSGGDLESAFSYAGRTVEIPELSRSNIAELIAVSVQLAHANYRQEIEDIVIPISRLGSSNNSADYLRASFASIRPLHDAFQIREMPGQEAVHKAMRDWRVWFRKVVNSGSIEGPLATLRDVTERCGSASASAILDHPLVSGRQKTAPVFLSILQPAERAGVRIYAFPPFGPMCWSIGVQVDRGAFRIDVTSNLEPADSVLDSIVKTFVELNDNIQ